MHGVNITCKEEKCSKEIESCDIPHKMFKVGPTRPYCSGGDGSGGGGGGGASEVTLSRS